MLMFYYKTLNIEINRFNEHLFKANIFLDVCGQCFSNHLHHRRGGGGGSGHEAVVQMSNEPTTDQCWCLRQKHVAVIC